MWFPTIRYVAAIDDIAAKRIEVQQQTKFPICVHKKVFVFIFPTRERNIQHKLETDTFDDLLVLFNFDTKR